MDLFLCSVFQVISEATETTDTSTPPVTVVCCNASSTSANVMMGPTSMGLPTLGQHDLILLPQFILRDTTTTSVPDTISGLCQLWHGFSTGKYLFQSQVSHQFIFHTYSIYVGVCYGVYFLLSGSLVAALFTNRDSTNWVCITISHQSICLAGICTSWCRFVAHARSAVSGYSSHSLE